AVLEVVLVLALDLEVAADAAGELADVVGRRLEVELPEVEAPEDVLDEQREAAHHQRGLLADVEAQPADVGGAVLEGGAVGLHHANWQLLSVSEHEELREHALPQRR